MTRSELLRKLRKRHAALTPQNIAVAVDRVFSTVTDTLARGGRVELRGFGVFCTTHRSARTARNPRTGEAVSLAAQRVPMFRCGKALHQRINESPLVGRK